MKIIKKLFHWWPEVRAWWKAVMQNDGFESLRSDWQAWFRPAKHICGSVQFGLVWFTSVACAVKITFGSLWFNMASVDIVAVTDSLWNRYADCRSSWNFEEILRPSSRRKSTADSLIGPSVSTAIVWNENEAGRSEYLTSFLEAAL